MVIMRDSNMKFETLIAPALRAIDLELLGCEYIPRGGMALLRVYIDSPAGITIDDCERASRQISAILDVEDPIRGRYTLEVSSPGIDRPLFKLEHFAQFVGQVVKLRLAQPIDHRRNFTGKLLKVEDNVIQLLVDNEVINLEFSDIEKANVEPTW